MASMAPQPPRRQSSAAQSSSQSSTPQDASLLDSQTVLVSRPSESATPPVQQDDQDLKKCWICFSDESEDTAETSAWRDPCPCALVAHEDCLLDWIADMESPTSRKRTLGPPAIVCPQCKAEIKLSRPRDAVVEVVRAMERVAAKALAPAAVTVACSAVVHSCVVHGVYTIGQIFGPQDAKRILQPLFSEIWSSRQPIDQVRNLLAHWRLRVGLPLITPILILSRTTLADSVLPVLPLLFFATQGDTHEPLDFASWPPSASMTMAVLPYLRSAYNLYYSRVWADREKQWLKDIQPRANQPPDGTLAIEEGNAADAVAEDENHFEIRIDGNIWDDWAGAEEEEAQQQEGNAAAHPFNAPPLPDDAPFQDQQPQAPQPQAPQQQPQNQPPQQQPQPQQNREERLLSFSTTTLAESLLGTLIFPTIASLSGNLLTRILPLSWTTKAPGSRATGLLQQKWGRSVVGGCLFVVVKDAVMLYVRYKMARLHRRRHVLDFERKGKKGGRA